MQINAVLCNLVQIGAIWCSLEQVAVVLSNLVDFGADWFTLVQLGAL